jgi:uncharacterized protein
MISLDTNLLLRLLLNDVPAQTKLVEQLLRSNPQVYVTDIVVTETVYVLENIYKLPRQTIHNLISQLLEMQQMVSNPYFLPHTLKLYLAKPALSFVDCYAACEAHYHRNRLYTFDKKLASQGGSHISLLA